MADLEKEVKQIEETFKRKSGTEKLKFLSSGSTMLNLALSGKARGGFPAGKYFLYVGDSGSGKTFFCLTCFAEAVKNPLFKHYDLIYDDVEDGALMDFEKFFGKDVANKTQAPSYEKDGTPKYSETVEGFYFQITKRLEEVEAGKRQPFIWVLDSMDALSSDAEMEKFGANRDAYESGKEQKKDYGDGKAKVNSRNIRKVTGLLSKTGSILIVICQTRDNIDAGMFGDDQTYAGGRALKFYAGAEIWTSAKNVYKEVNGNKRQVGIVTKLRVKKNRVSGKAWTVTSPIYWSYGIDDVEACLNFLRDEKVITGPGGRYRWEMGGEEHKVHGESNLIGYIEDNGFEEDMIDLVQQTWDGVEEACKLKRKPRYE